ncbi:MAG: nucleoside 2-deoxyribosyltransferase domain-containing protein [Methanosarcinaceae archaeon]|nr:nucleoside 2-deoxyribosyltransferase domain-containing protein [Methanosarcinaceae archaeon]
MTPTKTIYLAGPLFSEAEQDFNRKLRDILVKRGFSVFLPQEDSNDTTSMRHAQKQKHVFNKNCKAIDNSDIILAVLDGGSDVDSGTAWELGYAYAKGKVVLGLKTDFRTLGSEGTVNLMMEVSLDILVSNIDGLLKALEKYQ